MEHALSRFMTTAPENPELRAASPFRRPYLCATPDHPASLARRQVPATHPACVCTDFAKGDPSPRPRVLRSCERWLCILLTCSKRTTRLWLAFSFGFPPNGPCRVMMFNIQRIWVFIDGRFPALSFLAPPRRRVQFLFLVSHPWRRNSYLPFFCPISARRFSIVLDRL